MGGSGFKSKVKMCILFTIKCKNVKIYSKNSKTLSEEIVNFTGKIVKRNQWEV